MVAIGKCGEDPAKPAPLRYVYQAIDGIHHQRRIEDVAQHLHSIPDRRNAVSRREEGGGLLTHSSENTLPLWNALENPSPPPPPYPIPAGPPIPQINPHSLKSQWTMPLSGTWERGGASHASYSSVSMSRLVRPESAGVYFPRQYDRRPIPRAAMILATCRRRWRHPVSKARVLPAPDWQQHCRRGAGAFCRHVTRGIQGKWLGTREGDD